jgi:hypothetical protein
MYGSHLSSHVPDYRARRSGIRHGNGPSSSSPQVPVLAGEAPEIDEPQARQCAQLRMVTRCAAEVGLSKGTDGLRAVLSRPALRPRPPPTSRSWRGRWP